LTSTTEAVTTKTAEIGAAAQAQAEKLVASVADGASRFGDEARGHATQLAAAGASAAQSFLERIRAETDAVEANLAKLLEHGERMSASHRDQAAELMGASQQAAE